MGGDAGKFRKESEVVVEVRSGVGSVTGPFIAAEWR
jgi:hypothetical protein